MGRSLLILAVLAGVTVVARQSARGGITTGAGLRGWLWLAAGVGLQVLWVRVLSFVAAPPFLPHWLPSVALLPALWFLWLNRAYRGLWILAAGAALNLVVMLSNGGLMPISSATLHALGAAHHQGGVALALTKNRVLGDGVARLAFLDDRLVVVVAGVHVACSTGDLLVALGCLVTLGEEVCRGTRRSQKRGDSVLVEQRS